MLKKITLYAVVVLAVIIFVGLIAIMMWYFFVYRRRRRWSIEIHEQKTDGRVHSIGKDVIEERQKLWGTKTFYFLKKRKKVALPPPDRLVDRMSSGKEEVDYLQIERDLYPAEKKMKIDYTNPDNVKKITSIYDKLIDYMFSIKTTMKNKNPVREKYLYIPIEKTLTAKMDFKPIPYDVQLTAQRQSELHREFFKQKSTFWEKYGGLVLIVIVAIIVLLVVYLSYDFLNETIKATINLANANVEPLNRIADKLGAGKPPA